VIEVSELTKSYGDRTAIKAVSFSVKRGEILGFLGPNGAGKSTTMKILSGFMPATTGTATINGYNVATNPQEAKASLGYLPENPPVYMSMSVEDYLDFATRLHGIPSGKVKAAITDAMGKCGIADVRKRLIGNLSKGYRQRVGLAQAIAHNPPVLILDEPTVGLDPRQIIDIRNLIQSLGGDHTVILSTHILPEVQATCSRVVVIDKGAVVAQDTLQGIAARMTANSRLLLQLRKDPGAALNKLKSISGIVNITPAQETRGEYTLHLDCAKDADPRAEVAELCVKEGFGLLGLAQESISLEDAFVRLITKENHNAPIG
jgi:ABC-2 type transport system ATP-binding protein